MDNAKIRIERAKKSLWVCVLASEHLLNDQDVGYLILDDIENVTLDRDFIRTEIARVWDKEIANWMTTKHNDEVMHTQAESLLKPR